jgi:hypothetical protein
MDHIRGVKEKLLSFELFLNDYPEWADKVCDDSFLTNKAFLTVMQGCFDPSCSLDNRRSYPSG